MRHSIFYVIAIGFMCGIFLHSVFYFSLTEIFILFLISVVFMFVCIPPDSRRLESPSLKLRERWGGIVFCIFLFSLSFGLLRYHFFTSWHGDEYIKNIVEENVDLEGVIVEEPSPKESYTQLIVEVDSIDHQNIFPTKFLVMDGTYSKRMYGDRVVVHGKISEPTNFETENGRTFDYKKFLAKDRIFYQVRFASVTLVQSREGSRVKSVILSFKKKCIDTLSRTLPAPESYLAAGLVVAGKHALPKSIQDEFVKTGTVQVIVLSGYNVTIIAETLIIIFSSLPKMLGLSFSAMSVVMFAIAAGGSATIVRATLMVMISLSGKFLRRKYDVGRALIVSMIVMLIDNPMLLVFDPSFQLSCLATFGLIHFTPLVERHLSFVSDKFNFRNAVASTTATQIFVTPFLLYLTGSLSLVALPANLALFLVTPIAMLASFIVGLTEIFLPFLGVVTGFAAFVLLKLMLTLVHIFSVFPLASLSIHTFPLWGVFVFYFGYAVIMIRFSKAKTESHE